MARKAFETFEAVSAVVPREGGYYAAIATKPIGGAGTPRFNKLLQEQTFKTAKEADEAAAMELTRLKGVGADGELIW